MNQHERVWAYLLAHRATTDARDVSLNCDVSQVAAQWYIDRAHAGNWHAEMPSQSTTEGVRGYNVGVSNYSAYVIQPWDIWLEYDLNPWDADIVKRILRSKPNERRLDYEKIKHICDERIRQIDAGTN